MTLHCRFCNKICGELGGFKPDEILDIRCSECEEIHGTLSEMKELYREKTKGGNDVEFEKLFNTTNFKKIDFIKKLENK